MHYRFKKKSNKGYKSTKDGIAHMCGHDAHVSMLLVAAKIIATKKDQIRGIVKLIFQPAEEGGGGAKVMINENALTSPEVDEIYGLHVMNEMEVGLIGVKTGPIMANSDRFTITVTGSGGHGGIPYKAKDVIIAASDLVTSLQTIVSRNVTPFDQAIISVCQFHAGSTDNVLPGVATISGTIRTYSKIVQDLIIKRISEMCEGMSQVHNVKMAFNFRPGYPALINTDAETQKLKITAKKIVGDKNVVGPCLTMGAEDFAYYTQLKPGCFFFVGSHPENSVVHLSHHNESFDIEEDPTLLIGASIWVQIIQDLLINNLNSKL